MARTGRKQVPLGRTQPSFPDGWVLAVLDTWRRFAGDKAAEARLRLPTTSRTATRMRKGLGVEQATYDGWEAKLTALVTALFPRVSGINGFAGKYVREYFHLWNLSATAAPTWVRVAGATPAPAAVLARALVRDLLLRLCYLESCERRLTGSTDTPLLQVPSFEAVYQSLIQRRKPDRKDALEELAGELKVSSRTIRRWQAGTAVPSDRNLRDLATGGDRRLLSGLGFMDALLRQLGLREGPLAGEILQVAGLFLREYPAALSKFRGEVPIKKGAPAMRMVGFEKFVGFKDNLLLHPGWESVYAAMPDALWRIHVHTLRFARPFDLAQAYLRLAKPDNERGLLDFLEQAERRGDGDPLSFPT